MPTWQQVRARPWQSITQPHLLVDNVGDPDQHASAVLEWLAEPEL
ncbi:MAG TPA: hypothetical protein VFU35_05635 [Jatrophihabitans sp.]|nr:hypothetical protein [Jatrophihabitans sp.]